jgi:hypothetical protein
MKNIYIFLKSYIFAKHSFSVFFPQAENKSQANMLLVSCFTLYDHAVLLHSWVDLWIRCEMVPFSPVVKADHL